MKHHPLVERLAETDGSALLTPALLESWLQRPGVRVLFLGGDPVRFAEALDVAVVLPELRKALQQRFEIGVVPRDADETVARRFGVQRWPSLVWLRDGGYLGCVSGMLDWDVYLPTVARLLEAPVTRPPSIGIPLVSAGAEARPDAAHCH